MPASVLQSVTRRHRRRTKLPFVLLGIGIAAAATSVAAAQHWPRGREKPHTRAAAFVVEPKAAAPAVLKKLRAAVAEQRVAPRAPFASGTPLLSSAPPRLEHLRLAPLTAGSAILVDANTGAVLWAKRAHRRRAVASTTKIMTAVLALKRLPPDDVVTVARSVPRVPLVKEGLRAGERVAAWKLLYGLLLYSGNDDALALAIASAGSRARFVELMNLEARRLGLRDSHFSTPSGVIDDGNYSSASDLAALTRYAMRDARFRAIVRTRRKAVRWAPPTYAKLYLNKNRLLTTFRGADGVKTGWTTRAAHCLVASAHRGDVRLIAVVLRASDPYRDARRLLSYGFRLSG
jgi:serine-type D-Ala-D-Ala carboxypeptidase (penicillin-binding protein 5/6)